MDPQRKANQIKQTFLSLKERPKTTKMIQMDTGIPRENITWYIRYLEKRHKVVTVKEAPCEITKHSAKYYSTDRKYFPPVEQPELFPVKNPGAFSQ